MHYIKTECLWFCEYVNGIYMTSSIKTNPIRMVRARSHCVLNLYLITRYFCAVWQQNSLCVRYENGAVDVNFVTKRIFANALSNIIRKLHMDQACGFMLFYSNFVRLFPNSEQSHRFLYCLLLFVLIACAVLSSMKLCDY